jgi:transcriptional regulator with XRE-family HTH domain
MQRQRPAGSGGGRKRERTFGRVLQEIRKERGLSQEELCFESGYHRTYISFLERGKKNPTLSTIMDLAETLRVPASEMIRRVELRLETR